MALFVLTARRITVVVVVVVHCQQLRTSNILLYYTQNDFERLGRMTTTIELNNMYTHGPSMYNIYY